MFDPENLPPEPVTIPAGVETLCRIKSATARAFNSGATAIEIVLEDVASGATSPKLRLFTTDAAWPYTARHIAAFRAPKFDPKSGMDCGRALVGLVAHVVLNAKPQRDDPSRTDWSIGAVVRAGDDEIKAHSASISDDEIPF